MPALVIAVLALALGVGHAQARAEQEPCARYARDVLRYAIWHIVLEKNIRDVGGGRGEAIFPDFPDAMAAFRDDDPVEGVLRLAELENSSAQTDEEWEAVEQIARLRWFITRCDPDWTLRVPPGFPGEPDPFFLHFFPATRFAPPMPPWEPWKCMEPDAVHPQCADPSPPDRR